MVTFKGGGARNACYLINLYDKLTYSGISLTTLVLFHLIFFIYQLGNLVAAPPIYKVPSFMHAWERERERERERMVMVVEEVASSKLIVLPVLKKKQQNRINNSSSCNLSARKRELVCVTSGNSYLGSHIVKELLAYGYPVRVTIQNQGT